MGVDYPHLRLIKIFGTGRQTREAYWPACGIADAQNFEHMCSIYGSAMKTTSTRVAALLFCRGSAAHDSAAAMIEVLSDNFSHLMISSAHSGKRRKPAASIRRRAMRGSAEMNVECSRAQN